MAHRAAVAAAAGAFRTAVGILPEPGGAGVLGRTRRGDRQRPGAGAGDRPAAADYGPALRSGARGRIRQKDRRHPAQRDCD